MQLIRLVNVIGVRHLKWTLLILLIHDYATLYVLSVNGGIQLILSMYTSYSHCSVHVNVVYEKCECICSSSPIYSKQTFAFADVMCLCIKAFKH